VTSGIADQMADLLDAATKSAGTIRTRMDGISKSVADIDKDIEKKTARLSAREAELREQFVRLETLLGQYKTKSDSLTSSLSGLQNLSALISKR
jgi:flagellar hook-associated protein 2